MTKEQNKELRTNHYSKIWASAPQRSNEYYKALINTALYDRKLGSQESHESRHQVRLSIAHSEISSEEQRRLSTEARKDLRLHGQSTTRWVATTIETFQPQKQKDHCYLCNSHDNTCNCPINWLIWLC